jgi:hypothetical protein
MDNDCCPPDDCTYGQSPRRSARKTSNRIENHTYGVAISPRRSTQGPRKSDKTDKTNNSEDSYTKFLKSREKELRKKHSEEKKKKAS